MQMITAAFEAIVYVTPEHFSWMNAPLLYQKLKELPDAEIK